jgi:hypothetical protein
MRKRKNTPGETEQKKRRSFNTCSSFVVLVALGLAIYMMSMRSPDATPAVIPDTIEARAQAIMKDAAVGVQISRVSVIEVGSPKLLAMDFNMRQGLSGYEVDFTGRNMLEMACALYANGFADDWQYQFSAMVDLIDRSTGKTSQDDGLTVRVKSSTVAGWDCSNAALMDAAAAVDDYILNPVMTR